MNTYQKSYATFMESVCNQFNCREALPALKEGFKAFCEATVRLREHGVQPEFLNKVGTRIFEALTSAGIVADDDQVAEIISRYAPNPIGDNSYKAANIILLADMRSTDPVIDYMQNGEKPYRSLRADLELSEQTGEY